MVGVAIFFERGDGILKFGYRCGQIDQSPWFLIFLSLQHLSPQVADVFCFIASSVQTAARYCQDDSTVDEISLKSAVATSP